MSTQGPTICGTGADNSGIGTVAWSNPGNITANNGVYADAALTCFPAGTLVSMADGAQKAIEQLVAGDRVLSFSADGTISEDSVAAVSTGPAPRRYRLKAGDGSVEATSEHPFCTPSGFVPIGNLIVGDAVYALDRTSRMLHPVTLAEKEILLDSATVYNLQVTGNHTYIANGFCVHNKASSFRDNSVKLIVGGTVSGTDQSTGAAISTSGFRLDSYGGSTNLWGLSLTAADVNASNFGVAYSSILVAASHYLEATNFGFSIPSGVTINGIKADIEKLVVVPDVRVDYVQLTVYYTASGTSVEVTSGFFF